jgi:CBS domain-containing protein
MTQALESRASCDAGLIARWSLVTARDLMRTDLVTIDRFAPLAEAARLLVGNGISGAPVTDAQGRVVGVVSLRDLVERYAEEARSRPGPPRESEESREASEAEETVEDLEDEIDARSGPVEDEDLVEDVMTSEIRSVPADASLAEIAAEMKRHSVHRLLVEDHGRYVGLVGTLEVLDLLFP